jgi:hypothetical protein
MMTLDSIENITAAVHLHLSESDTAPESGRIEMAANHWVEGVFAVRITADGLHDDFYYIAAEDRLEEASFDVWPDEEDGFPQVDNVSEFMSYGAYVESGMSLSPPTTEG